MDWGPHRRGPFHLACGVSEAPSLGRRPRNFPGNLTRLPCCFAFVFRLNRASQTYFFPIHLTDQLLPSAVFYATVGPLVVYFAMHRLIIKPYLRAQKER